MKDLLEKIGFTPEETEEILENYGFLSKNPTFFEILQSAEKQYRESGSCDYEEIYEKAGKAAQACGIHSTVGGLCFFVHLLPEAEKKYKLASLPDSLFNDSFSDLVYKARLTKERFGVMGEFTSWFGRFYDLTRFKIGRLEYETYKLKYDYKGYKSGDEAINIHIPEDGALDRARVLSSYADAAKFYADKAKDNTLVLICSSWLLSKELRDMLPKNSNIRAFSEDFDILNYRREKGFPDGWRVFGNDMSENADELPANTSLQRLYRKYLKTHKTTTVGYGAFLYKI